VGSVRIKNILLTGMALFMPVIGVSAQSFRDSVELEPIVVTASHTPKALKDAPVVTRLITLHDIKITDATNIQDLLIQEISEKVGNQDPLHFSRIFHDWCEVTPTMYRIQSRSGKTKNVSKPDSGF
jgi:AraC-like DNA-binding protein